MDSSVPTDPAPAPDGAPTDATVDAKAKKKELKRLLEASSSRPLETWERYRALNDAMDEAYEVIDMSNREVRFALILVGGLNAFVLIAATKAEVVNAIQGFPRLLAGGFLAVYAIAAGRFLMEIITALRPGRFRPWISDWSTDRPDYPKGVRYFEDVITRDVAAHWQAWNEVLTDQLNAELAVQLHSICLKANARRLGLRKIYADLRVMALLVIGLLAIFVTAAWR